MSGQRKRAIDMSCQLLKYLERNCTELPGYARRFCLVSYSYALDLAWEKRYKDAIEAAERGRELGIQFGEYQCLPGYLAIQAECYYFLGEAEKSKRLYRQAYYTYMTHGDMASMEIMRQEMEERLGIKMPSESD